MKKKQKSLKSSKIIEKESLFSNVNKFMEQPIYLVFLLFILGTAIRFYLSYFQGHIFLFTDEIILLEISRCIASGCELAVRSIPYHFIHLLYPLIIAPANMINDAVVSFAVLKLINSLVMNSAVFPVFFLSKRIIGEKAFFMAIFSLILPDLSFVSSVFAEILLYPICMWFFFFLWMFIESGKNKKWLIGVFLTAIAAFFVKAVAAALLLGTIIFLIAGMFFEDGKKNLPKAISVSIVAFISLILILLFINKTSAAYLVNFSYISDIGRLWAICRYFMYFLAFASLAYGIYFIVFPMLSFKNMDKDVKQFFIALTLCFISATIAVIFIVSMYEDYPSSAMTPHLRYLFHFIMPFCIVFFSISDEGISKKSKIFALLFVLFMQWGIVRFPEGNYTAFMDIAYLRESLACPFVSIPLGFISMKMSAFDIIKILILFFTIFMSFLIFKDRIKEFKKYIFIFFIVSCLINNIFCYKAGFETISKNVDILRWQVVAMNDALKGSKVLLISKFAASEKVFETYFKEKYWFTTEKMYKSACGNYYFKEAPIPLISVQWAAELDSEKAKSSKWCLLDNASSVSDPVISKIDPDYIVVGPSAFDMRIISSPNVIIPYFVPAVTNYKVYKVIKDGR